MTLSQHVKDRNDPHGTRKLVHQCHCVYEIPEDLSPYNNGDVILSKPNGVMYRVTEAEDGYKYLESVSLVSSTPMSGVTVSLDTYDDLFSVVKILVERLGGIVQ